MLDRLPLLPIVSRNDGTQAASHVTAIFRTNPVCVAYFQKRRTPSRFWQSMAWLQQLARSPTAYVWIAVAGVLLACGFGCAAHDKVESVGSAREALSDPTREMLRAPVRCCCCCLTLKCCCGQGCGGAGVGVAVGLDGAVRRDDSVRARFDVARRHVEREGREGFALLHEAAWRTDMDCDMITYE